MYFIKLFLQILDFITFFMGMKGRFINSYLVFRIKYQLVAEKETRILLAHMCCSFIVYIFFVQFLTCVLTVQIIELIIFRLITKSNFKNCGHVPFRVHWCKI